MNEPTDYWVYILLCENNTYYTGYTNNLHKRYRSHKEGTGGCKYTRSFKPQSIAQCWKINGNKSLAMQMERYIKQLPRQEKVKIINNPVSLSTDVRIQTVSLEERLGFTS
jgi:putative endonuclease